jgi:rhodanese-related sulfurtransferase
MKFKNISPQDARAMVALDEALLIDVREPGEFATKHIPGATLLPLGKVTASDLPKTDKKIIIYCLKGGRGNSACNKITSEDESLTIFNIEGGITAWEQAGLPVKQGDRTVLPLDRQVQLTIGSAVLLGSLATHFIDPAFLIIPAFFGAGLTFAGASGFCGLARVMAKMPWNQKLS